MSDLFASLSATSQALSAQRMGLEVVGQNIANVNTPGYSRRVVDLAEIAPNGTWSAGGGVEVTGIRSVRDTCLESRLQLETSAEQREAAVADSLSVIEAGLGAPGTSIDGKLTAFFDAFAQLADAPTSSTARLGVISQGSELAAAFRQVSEQLSQARWDANTKIRTAVDAVNALSRKIAEANGAIVGQNPALTLNARDGLAAAIADLSKLVDISTVQRSDGAADVTFANGQALVIGNSSYDLSAVPDANGVVGLVSQDLPLTADVTGGEIGGLLHVRDGLLPDYLRRLDDIAYTVTGQVNGLHSAGVNLDGQPGGMFFTPLAGVAGAAAGLAVDPAIASNPRAVAAGASAAAGDNQTARAIAALRDGHVLSSGTATLTDGWAELVYRIGQDSSAARQDQESRGAIVRQVNAMRDAVSGVSLDEEAAMMMRFQRAYEANARYFQSVDSAINTLMQMIGG
jgi:flagellar hook-associated protein 1 FlgK